MATLLNTEMIRPKNRGSILKPWLNDIEALVEQQKCDLRAKRNTLKKPEAHCDKLVRKRTTVAWEIEELKQLNETYRIKKDRNVKKHRRNDKKINQKV